MAGIPNHHPAKSKHIFISHDVSWRASFKSINYILQRSCYQVFEVFGYNTSWLFAKYAFEIPSNFIPNIATIPTIKNFPTYNNKQVAIQSL